MLIDDVRLIAGVRCARSPSPIRGLPDRWIGDTAAGRLVVRHERTGRVTMRWLPRFAHGGLALTARPMIEAATLDEAVVLFREALRCSAT